MKYERFYLEIQGWGRIPRESLALFPSCLGFICLFLFLSRGGEGGKEFRGSEARKNFIEEENLRNTVRGVFFNCYYIRVIFEDTVFDHFASRIYSQTVR